MSAAAATQRAIPGDGESRGSKISRRLKSIPMIPIGFVLITALFAPLLLIAFAADAIRRVSTGKPFVWMRLLVMTWMWLLADMVGLTGLLITWLTAGLGSNSDRLQGAAFAIQQGWARWMYFWARTLFRFRIEVEGAEVAATGPYILLVRHTSILDNLLPSATIAGPFRVRLRYVLKRELLFDPCFDVAGLRLPNHFVRRDTGDASELDRVSNLGRGMGSGDGVLIYPEGTRADEARRLKAIERISKRDPERAERMSALENCMPPRQGGPMALFEAAPDADVVILKHAGFDGIRELGDVFAGDLFGRRVVVNIERIQRDQIPAGEGLADWLDETWLGVDRWVSKTLKELADAG